MYEVGNVCVCVCVRERGRKGMCEVGKVCVN